MFSGIDQRYRFLSDEAMRAARRPMTDRVYTVKETVFAGMPTYSFANAEAAVIDGDTYVAGIPAGGAVAIVANGIKVNHPTSGAAECSWGISGAQGVVKKAVGNSVARRGGWGYWARVAEYNASTTFWSYVINFSGGYPAHSGGIRRARNTQGAPNNATGSYTWWSVFNGADTSGVFSGNSEISDNGNATHNGAEDVVLMYFRSTTAWDCYYGTWANGQWPRMEDMVLGARHDIVVGTNHVKLREVSIWGLGFGGGGYSGVNTQFITIDRWRFTVWD